MLYSNEGSKRKIDLESVYFDTVKAAFSYQLLASSYNEIVDTSFQKLRYMAYISSYKELIVWQKAINLVKEIYLVSEKFPRTELYGLTSQIRRAAVSVPSNIAEGYGRKSIKEYSQFYSIAYGSLLEVETQIIIAKELAFISASMY